MIEYFDFGVLEAAIIDIIVSVVMWLVRKKIRLRRYLTPVLGLSILQAGTLL